MLQRLAEVTGLDRALPANGGAEAVETALKAARKWGHKIKGIPADSAEIIVCAGNFHGRSITIVGFSSEPQYRDGFGPFAPGFRQVPYGDAEALARAIGPNTAAFLVEPIQGEGGIVVPPAGLSCASARASAATTTCSSSATRSRPAWAAPAKFLACEHENVKPDGVILGKALGGGLLPVSALVGTDDLMQVFSPGDHGSTFGGNPLASAVGLAALDVLFDEGPDRALGGAGRASARASAHGAEPADPRGSRQGTLHRRRGRPRPDHRARCRRPAAGARHPVEGHARHRRAVRAAAHHRPRDARLGGRGSARRVRGAGRRIEAGAA